MYVCVKLMAYNYSCYVGKKYLEKVLDIGPCRLNACGLKAI